MCDGGAYDGHGRLLAYLISFRTGTGEETVEHIFADVRRAAAATELTVEGRSLPCGGIDTAGGRTASQPPDALGQQQYAVVRLGRPTTTSYGSRIVPAVPKIWLAFRHHVRHASALSPSRRPLTREYTGPWERTK